MASEVLNYLRTQLLANSISTSEIVTPSCLAALQSIQELLGAFKKNKNAVFNGEEEKDPLFV